jgi:hypothetical protein
MAKVIAALIVSCSTDDVILGKRLLLFLNGEKRRLRSRMGIFQGSGVRGGRISAKAKLRWLHHRQAALGCAAAVFLEFLEDRAGSGGMWDAISFGGYFLLIS